MAEPRTGVQGWRVIVVCVPGHRQSAFGRAVVAVVGGCVGGIATIGLRHAGDTPWRGVYGSKTPRWRGRIAVAEQRMGVQGWRVVVVCVPGHRQSAFGRAVVAVGHAAVFTGTRQARPTKIVTFPRDKAEKSPC